MEVLRSSTNLVCLLGRVETHGPQDYAAVHEIQDGLKLTPLSQFGPTCVPPKASPDPTMIRRRPRSINSGQ